jgi:hypothetical protein
MTKRSDTQTVSDNQNPKIRVLPGRHGLAWMMQSLLLMRAQPARLLFLAVLLQLLLGLTRIPLLGLLIVIAVPALTAGLLQAFGEVAAGRPATSAALFAPMASGPRTGRLMAMGAVLFAVGILSVSLVLSGSTDLLDAELLARLEQGDMEAVAMLDPDLIMRFALAIAVGVSISGTLSFLAIPLVWFNDSKLGAAFLSGLQALLMNWKPYTVLALAMTAILIPIALAIAVLFQAAGSAGVFAFILLGVIMLLALAFQMLVFGTQYCSYRDIYGIKPDPSDPPGSDQDDTQLLA